MTASATSNLSAPRAGVSSSPWQHVRRHPGATIGTAILLIHSDLDELLALAHRVLVMYEGRLVETDWPNCSREASLSITPACCRV